MCESINHSDIFIYLSSVFGPTPEYITYMSKGWLYGEKKASSALGKPKPSAWLLSDREEATTALHQEANWQSRGGP